MNQPEEMTVEEYRKRYGKPGMRARTTKEIDAQPKSKQRPFPANKKLTPNLFVSGLDRYCCPVCNSLIWGRYEWTPAAGALGYIRCMGCDWQRTIE